MGMGKWTDFRKALTSLPQVLQSSIGNDKIAGKGIFSMHAKFPVTVHMFFLRGNEILLIRRYHTGYMDGYYSLPAGHLDGNEPVRQAAVREAHEEIGVGIDPVDIHFAGVFHRSEGDERVDFFLHVPRWAGEPVNAEPEKCDELRWADISDLPGNTIPYIRRAIENYRSGVLFEEFGWGKSQPGPLRAEGLGADT
jgi:8-oxo-dGTP diphosphatase